MSHFFDVFGHFSFADSCGYPPRTKQQKYPMGAIRGLAGECPSTLFDGLWVESQELFKRIYALEVRRSSAGTAVDRHKQPLFAAPFGALVCLSFSLHVW